MKREQKVQDAWERLAEVESAMAAREGVAYAELVWKVAGIVSGLGILRARGGELPEGVQDLMLDKIMRMVLSLGLDEAKKLGKPVKQFEADLLIVRRVLTV